MPLIAIFAVGIAALVVGAGAGYVVRKQIAQGKVASAEARVGSIINDAKSKAQATEIEAKQKAIKIHEEAKHEEIERRKELSGMQARLEKRETLFDKQLLDLKEKFGITDDPRRMQNADLCATTEFGRGFTAPSACGPARCLRR